MTRDVAVSTPSEAITRAARLKARQRRKTLGNLSAAGSTLRAIRNDLLPALALATHRVASLTIPRRNARKLDPDHVRAVASAISTLGFTVPVLVTDDGTVVDGVVRIEAAKLIGLAEIPCLSVSHLSKPELKLLRIALNRLQERGAWDFDVLKLELEELVLDDAPIEISGFSPTEIDTILLSEELEPTEPGPLEPDASEPASAKLGDLFQLGPHRLICGDARDPKILATLMAGDAASFIFTDQPYNLPIAGHVSGSNHREFAMASGEMTAQEFEAFTIAWMAAALPRLQDGGLLGTFIDWRGLSVVQAAAAHHRIMQLNLIVWAKTGAGMGSLYRSQHELLPLFKKGVGPHTNNIALGKNGRWRSNVWTYPGATSPGSDARRGLKDHPTVKPVAMLEDALFDLTNRGDVILDPFAGSGSTLIAVERTGRICRAIEIDPRYVDLIIRRYKETAGEAEVGPKVTNL